MKKKPDDEMNIQEQLAKDYWRQLNHLRAMCESLPPASALPPVEPSAARIATQAVASFLMVANTEEEVRSYIRKNPEATRCFLRSAAQYGGTSAPYPPDQMRAVDEEHFPFHVLGWLAQP
jgi:hypothetical protein